MSGAEAVIGLVLGGFPLIVSALEHYQDCFEKLKCWREYKVEHRRCLRRVERLRLEYLLTLDKLFLNEVESTEELDRLKRKPYEYGWNDLEKRLRRRLQPEAWKIYLDSMRDMHDYMQDLESELGCRKEDIHEREMFDKVGALLSLQYQS